MKLLLVITAAFLAKFGAANKVATRPILSTDFIVHAPNKVIGPIGRSSPAKEQYSCQFHKKCFKSAD